MRRRSIFVSALVVLAGCGASAQQQEVAAVIRASDAAWERGDVERACSYLTSRARRESVLADVAICTEQQAFESVSNGEVAVQHLYVDEAEPRRMTAIRVDGDTAVASYSDGDSTRLRRLNGRWLIDSF